MPDDNKGIIGTIKERWAKFRSAGDKREKPKPRVDTSRVSARPLKPQMSPEQKRAVQRARKATKASRPKSSRSYGR